MDEPLKNKMFSFATLNYCQKIKTEIVKGKSDLWTNKDDLKSAIRGFEHELINDYMGDELPFINIHIKKFSKLAKKWFPDAIVNDTKERVE